jgi:eukaryotic-like serine/threonine-protein kinase
MPGAKWDRAQRLFSAAADLSPSGREIFLDQSCAGDPELRAEVESLIRADSGSSEYIAAAVASEASSLLDSQFPGDRMGPYRVLRPLGLGGMGAVFLAIRDDDQYQSQVAIKVVKWGMDTAEVLGRFRHERQILANLDHPYIARLFDGGTTGDGLPYFVMEFVEGEPVDTFCRERKLDIKARLRLFLKVCEAVAYAHRNLVVHRDLKPANIFVTATGTPKLLDFGISKLVSADAAGTGTAFQVFTPDYASPEQVRGEPVSTATDVYSLGAILFELLTGERAQKVTATTPLEVDRAICQTEVARPSLIVRNIHSDLDNIVLMAMRKEPGRRYASADQLAADVERHLDGEPIVARQNSVLYRTGKFLRRNWWEAAAACVVAGSLVAATVISGLQYRRAEAERRIAVGERHRAEEESRQAVEARQAEARVRLIADQQRDQAQIQRARAEQRVNDLIDLANKTLFDVNDAVQSLPGALAARQMIVKTTLSYLERLEKDVGEDQRIRLVLISAYYKVGLIQGDTESASLHDFPGAQASFLKAEALIMPMSRARADDPDLLFRRVKIEGALADILFRMGQRNAAAEAFRKLLPAARSVGQLRPNDVESAKEEALILGRLGVTLHVDAPADGVEQHQKALAILRDLVIRFPRDSELKQDLATGLADAGGAFQSTDRLDQAAESFRQAILLREELLRVDPANLRLQRNLLVANGNYAVVLGGAWTSNLGRFAEAREAGRKAIAIAHSMVAADPQDANARFDLSMSLSRLGAIEPEAGGAAASLAALQEAITLMEPIFRSNPKAMAVASQLAITRELAGNRLESLGRSKEAAEQYQASLALTAFEWGGGRELGQAIADREALALLYGSSGERERAFDYARRAVEDSKQMVATSPSDRATARWARSYFVLGSVHWRFGEPGDARKSAERALELWRQVRDPRLLAFDKKAIEQAGEIVKKSEAVARPERLFEYFGQEFLVSLRAASLDLAISIMGFALGPSLFFMDARNAMSLSKQTPSSMLLSSIRSPIFGSFGAQTLQHNS